VLVLGAACGTSADASVALVGGVESQARPREGNGSSGDARALITGDRMAFCKGDMLLKEARSGDTGLKAPPSAATPPLP
jgi:hypothetical protein